MAPPPSPKNQTLFDDEISLLDIIQFFKTHFKRILFFIILGGILGYLYGKLAPPVYEGSTLISPAKVAGVVVVDPKITLTKLSINSYYSKETFLACNPTFYKDKDKEIDYDMSNIIKTSISKDGNLIEIKMSHSNKGTIHRCLESVTSDINKSQKILTDPLVELKKNQLNVIETKLMLSEKIKDELESVQIKNFKTNKQPDSITLLYTISILNNALEISTLKDQLTKIKMDLSSEQTKDADKVLPVSIELKKIASLKLRVLLGLCLGLCLGIFFAFIKQIKIY